ncbi:unnamed protein product [Microthlaspi erraticum]|uniref:Uncharacterized protein n=1 Tax=Microthlaspi erraticum TaxID=1685480 RepID=A0A6D2IZE7_9BRAS|nr:unnamed protein product [Microthlaspi erraticum]
MRRLGALATFSAHACEGSRSSGITQKLDERLHPGTTVHRGTRFILPSIGLTGAPCQCLVGSHIVIWYHTRPRQLTRLSSESSSLHAQPPRCQSGWALTCENALDYTFLDNMWLDTPHVLSLLEHLEHMGREEQGRTWCMDAAQLDTQRKKEEVILKTSSTTYSTIRSSSSTRPAKLQLDRAEKSTVKPEKCCFPLDFL